MQHLHGDDDSVVIDCINTEMIDLGNNLQRYSLDETLGKFFPDYYIKCFLMNYLDATSWKSVIENVKKVCYKGYPGRQLSTWDKISI